MSGGGDPRARRPGRDEHAPFYAGYVSLVPDGDVLVALEETGAALVAALRAVPADGETFAYEPGKWTVREIVGHLVDSERLFSYRAAHIARGDPAPLPSMDQEVWAAASNAAERPLAGLVDELETVREGTLALFRGLSPEAWDRRGVASGAEVSVRALAWIIAGHGEHHRRVLEERYGVAAAGGGEAPGGETSARPSLRIPRRRDRGKDDGWIRSFLKAAPLGFLAVPDGDGPPHVNSNIFLYDDDARCLYLHTARLGRLRDLMERGPRVSFTAAAMGRLLPADEALEFSVEYAAVVVTGRARVVEDEAEQGRVLQALLDRYAPHLRPGQDYRPPVPAELKRTAVYRVDIETWSGKEKAVEPDFPGAFRAPEPEIPFRG